MISIQHQKKKYYRFIQQWGGWDLFQELLKILKIIADKHNVEIANVATKFILDKPSVGGVIIGCRLSLTDHGKENLKTLSLLLTNEDRNQIDLVAAKGKLLPGDCGDEYRQ